MRKPDFKRNTLRVLQKGKPERPALFELFLNPTYYARLAGRESIPGDSFDYLKLVVEAMAAAGYDYASTHASSFGFDAKPRAHLNTVSLNDGAVITDWESFEKYTWHDPESYDVSNIEKIAPFLPEGMKLMIMGPCGVLENLIALIGYENLCVMLYDEPGLVKEVVDHIGSALVRYYDMVAGMDTVGFLCSNDDWGFNTQTFLSPEDMRKYIFPWHKRIVEVAHKHGKPCILHSCGYFDEVIEDIIEDMKFDGRHSYEDNICPVEQAYDRLAGRIAVMGGIDMDFITRGEPDQIYARSKAMLERSKDRGCYLLGSGNSVPEYVPFENYMAMVRAATEE